jgi:hypothetical protein
MGTVPEFPIRPPSISRNIGKDNFALDRAKRLLLFIWIMRKDSFLRLASCSCVLAISVRAVAASNTPVHLGLESSLYSSTSISGSVNAGTSQGTVDQTVTEVGFPGSTFVSMGALLGDQFDLGLRFGYLSQKSESGVGSSSLKITTFEFDPYLAFVTGSNRDTLRAAFGITGGLGSTSVNESSADSKSYGAFIRLYGFVGNTASIDPAITVQSAHHSSSGIDFSGLTGMLSLGVSLWPSRSVMPADERPRHRAAENSDASASDDGASAVSPRVVNRPTPGIVVLKFGDERTMTFVRDAKGAKPSIVVLVRDPTQEGMLSVCNQLTFHALNQEDQAVVAAWGTASSQAMRFGVLKASVPVETLSKMVAAPIANNAAVPEHWIDVCTQRWKITEEERSHLKEFVENLPPGDSAPANAPPESNSAPESSQPVPESVPAGQ